MFEKAPQPQFLKISDICHEFIKAKHSNYSPLPFLKLLRKWEVFYIITWYKFISLIFHQYGQIILFPPMPFFYFLSAISVPSPVLIDQQTTFFRILFVIEVTNFDNFPVLNCTSHWFFLFWFLLPLSIFYDFKHQLCIHWYQLIH